MTIARRRERHTHAIPAGDSAVQGVIEAVAAATDRSPLELPPIGEAVDPDALNRILATESDHVEVTFDYLGHAVVATPEEVRVRADEE